MLVALVWAILLFARFAFEALITCTQAHVTRALTVAICRALPDTA